MSKRDRYARLDAQFETKQFRLCQVEISLKDRFARCGVRIVESFTPELSSVLFLPRATL
jgi:hypothetical protein